MFVKTAALQLCSKFTGEQPCGNVISVKLACNFTETALPHGCFPAYLLHICKTHFLKNTYLFKRLLLNSMLNDCNVVKLDKMILKSL